MREEIDSTKSIGAVKPAREISLSEFEVRTVPAQQTFILDDPLLVWLVRSGTAAVFSSEVENGRPVGRRRLLFRARPQDALFTLADRGSPHPQRLVAFAETELTLCCVPLRLIELAFSNEAFSLNQAVEGWINNITDFISNRPVPAGSEAIDDSGDRVFDSGQSVHPRWNTCTWVRVTDGEALLLNDPEMKLVPTETFLPLGNGMWFTAVGEMKVKIHRTDEISAAGDLLAGLASLHTLLLNRLVQLDAEVQCAELQRLEDRRLRQERLTRSALETMAAVLNPRKAPSIRENPLLSAVVAVGDVLGIEIRPPLQSEDWDRVRDPLDAITRASRVRRRRVLLRGNWWESDSGPLIGYLKENYSPVALLPKRAGYDVFDPGTGQTVSVDVNVAHLLAPEAVMIYRTLPDKVRKPWQLVRFSLRGRFRDVVFILVVSLLATLIGMLTPQAMAVVMDNAIPDSNRRLLLELGLGLVAANIGVGLFGLARGLVAIRASLAIDATIEAALWDRLLWLRTSFFKRYSSGDLLARVMSVREINSALNGSVLQSILASVMALLNLGLLFYYNANLALIAIGLAAVTGAVTIVGGYFVRRYNLVLVELSGELFGLVVQIVNAVSKIRVAGAEQRAFSLWLTRYAAQLKLVQKSQSVEDYTTVFNQAIPTLSTILLFWFAASLLTGAPGGPVAGSGLTVGIFLAFNTALATFISGAASLSDTIIDVSDTLTRSKRIQPILDAEPEVSNLKVDPARLDGSVTLSHVDFRYEAQGPKILEDINLHVSPGEFVALVGPSGSGKSTILRLLLGFETPDSGKILFDGQDLAGLDVTAVRRQMGVVMQSGVLNAESILENIAGGALITLEEAWEAVIDAGLSEDIKEMPMQLHTFISEGGGNLSGGQRQRLLIARALVTRPRILFMDEATSALDNQTQSIVSESLKRRKVTRIVIAHRLSTIKDADRIYVLDQGRIVEQGRFDDLAGRNGTFATMIARQTA